jgi:hypothetical protein
MRRTLRPHERGRQIDPAVRGKDVSVMIRRIRFSHIARATYVAIAFGCMSLPAMAQSPAALPTAPGADRTVTDGPATAARASLRGDNGSPLEPYLFMFILAGGGIISAISVRLADARIRGEFKGDAQTVLGVKVPSF